MQLPELLIIAVGLSMDCFAVSVSFGSSRKLTWRNILLMSLFFGFFQGMMPLIGWLVGQSFKSLVESFDHWIAFGILAIIGVKMIWQSFLHESEKKQVDITQMPVVLSLAVATSIDALITGISFGFMQVNILEATLVIGVVTFLVSVAGAKLAGTTSFIPASWTERLGGLVLIAIGLRILIEHLSTH